MCSSGLRARSTRFPASRGARADTMAATRAKLAAQRRALAGAADALGCRFARRSRALAGHAGCTGCAMRKPRVASTESSSAARRASLAELPFTDSKPHKILCKTTPPPPACPTCACTASARRSEVPAVLDWIDRHCPVLGAETVSARGRSGPRAGGRHRLARSTYRDSIARRWTAMRCAARRPPGRASTTRSPFRCSASRCRASRSADAVPINAAIRIMTGAPVPDGARCGGAGRIRDRGGGRIAITRPVAPGQHVGHVGEDIGKGTAALRAGRRLRPQDVGLIASLGLARVSVVQRPRVRILVTGNEVQAPGDAERSVSDLRREFLHAARSRRSRWRRARGASPARRRSG